MTMPFYAKLPLTCWTRLCGPTVAQSNKLPSAHMTAEHICLADYAARTDGLIRFLIEDDKRKQGMSCTVLHTSPNRSTVSKSKTPMSAETVRLL